MYIFFFLLCVILIYNILYFINIFPLLTCTHYSLLNFFQKDQPLPRTLDGKRESGNRGRERVPGFEWGLVGVLCSSIVGGASWYTTSCVKEKLSMDGIVDAPLGRRIINGRAAVFLGLVCAYISRHPPFFSSGVCYRVGARLPSRHSSTSTDKMAPTGVRHRKRKENFRDARGKIDLLYVSFNETPLITWYYLSSHLYRIIHHFQNGIKFHHI